MKIEPKKFEKSEIKSQKSEIREFMIEEYKTTNHYKNKMEDKKMNKIMGRLKKKAKGANPLSCKRKKIRNDVGGKDEIQLKDLKNDKVFDDGKKNDNQNLLKKKRQRQRKNKE